MQKESNMVQGAEYELLNEKGRTNRLLAYGEKLGVVKENTGSGKKAEESEN